MEEAATLIFLLVAKLPGFSVVTIGGFAQIITTYGSRFTECLMPTYHCDRCKKKFEGDEHERFTCGFYYVSPGSSWEKFGRPYETVVCDECMMCSPEYIAVYGDMSCKCFRP